jgi:hypothetical protein
MRGTAQTSLMLHIHSDIFPVSTDIRLITSPTVVDFLAELDSRRVYSGNTFLNYN